MSAPISAGDDETIQQLHLGQEVSSEWWELFHSQPLNDLVRQAVENNQTLVAAQATLAQAQKVVAQARGALYPQIDASAQYQRQKIGVSTPASNLYSVGATASYALDVFGGTRRQIERQQALADNQLQQLGAAYLALTGNVVIQSVTLASSRAQLAAAKEIVAGDEENLKLVREKYEAGKAARTDILTAESQLANDRTQLAPLEQQISVANHAITVLVGQFPVQWSPPRFDLTSFALPADLPLSLPSDLVRQRPDIRAAEAQLHAASAAIGVATAQIYPSITLSGDLATQALATSNLFSGSSLVRDFAAALTAPIFHGGALEMQRQAAVDAFKASEATYQQTVLQAFGQVADTLRALRHDADLLNAQKQALDTADAALTLQRLSYVAGKTDLLHLIDAERTYQQARLGYVRAQAQRYLDTAQLFVALGGGWWNTKNSTMGNIVPRTALPVPGNK